MESDFANTHVRVNAGFREVLHDGSGYPGGVLLLLGFLPESLLDYLDQEEVISSEVS